MHEETYVYIVYACKYYSAQSQDSHCNGLASNLLTVDSHLDLDYAREKNKCYSVDREIFVLYYFHTANFHIEYFS